MLLPEMKCMFMVTVRLTQTQMLNDWLKMPIQSADSAKAFGIDPRIAMISYSTHTGCSADVEKVAKATEIANNVVLTY